jgi:hypothetical protein
LPRGRRLSLTLVVFGVLLLAFGAGAAVSVWFGLLAGLGVGAVVVGAALLAGGLFFVPLDGPVRSERPIHGVIP